MVEVKPPPYSVSISEQPVTVNRRIIDPGYDVVEPDPRCSLCLSICSIICCCYICGCPALVLSVITMCEQRRRPHSALEMDFLERVSCSALVIGTIGCVAATIWVILVVLILMFTALAGIDAVKSLLQYSTVYWAWKAAGGQPRNTTMSPVT